MNHLMIDISSISIDIETDTVCIDYVLLFALFMIIFLLEAPINFQIPEKL